MKTRAEKKRAMDALVEAGTWEEAAEFRERERQRLRDAGKTKEEAVDGAWDAMAEKYVPNVEEASPAFQVILPGGAESIDDVLDSEYTETDPARQMADAYEWIQGELHRIVSDDDGGVVDLTKASTPPPVGIAVAIAQSWAAKPSAQRTGLFREMRAWINSKSPTNSDPDEDDLADEGDCSYLDRL